MAEEILKFTKLTFIIHFVIGLIFTILFFIPDIIAPLYGISSTTETRALGMVIGSLYAGLTASSLFGFLAKEWKEVKIVVIAEIVWLVVGLIAHIINFSVYAIGSAVLSLIIVILFIVLFLLTFLQQEEKIKTLWK
ncbi:MAG: hypothetical protein ACFFE4_11360 [Candidatus Thorarchaeota archaeon]